MYTQLYSIRLTGKIPHTQYFIIILFTSLHAVNCLKIIYIIYCVSFIQKRNKYCDKGSNDADSEVDRNVYEYTLQG